MIVIITWEFYLKLCLNCVKKSFHVVIYRKSAYNSSFSWAILFKESTIWLYHTKLKVYRLINKIIYSTTIMVSLDLWATYRLRIITVPAGNSTALPAGKSQLRPSIQHKEKSSLQVSHSWNPQYGTRRNPDHYCFKIKESQSSQSTQSNWINSSHFEVPKNLVKLKSSHIKLKQTKDYQNISSIQLIMMQ